MDARVELDPRAVHPKAAAASRGARCSVGVRFHELERAVVAGRDDGIVHGRVEASAGPFPRVERELDDARQIR